jgi:hypothetical protein
MDARVKPAHDESWILSWTSTILDGLTPKLGVIIR